MESPRRIIAVAVALVVVSACSASEESTPPTTTAVIAPPTTAATVTTPAPSTTEPAPTTAPATTAPPTTASATTASATTEPTTPPTTEPDPNAEFIALARSAVLDLSVFPEDWTEGPADDEEESEEDQRFAARVDECLGVEGDKVSDAFDDREVKSPEFVDIEDETQPSVDQEVVVADDEAMAIAAMAEVATEGADACLQESIQAFFEADPDFQDDESGIELGAVVVTRADLGVPLDERVAFVVEIPLTFNDETFVQYLEVLYQRQGRALSQLQLASFGVPFDRDGFEVLADEVDARLAAIDG